MWNVVWSIESKLGHWGEIYSSRYDEETHLGKNRPKPYLTCICVNELPNRYALIVGTLYRFNLCNYILLNFFWRYFLSAVVYVVLQSPNNKLKSLNCINAPSNLYTLPGLTIILYDIILYEMGSFISPFVLASHHLKYAWIRIHSAGGRE